MTGSDPRAAAIGRMLDARTAQGLAAHVTDDRALRSVAVILQRSVRNAA